MDRLIDQQSRMRSSAKKGVDSYSSREGQTPSKRTVSFGEEKSGVWFPQRFSRKMSEDDESRGYDYATAIAAATYAVNSLQERSQNRNDQTIRSPSELTKARSKENEILQSTVLRTSSRWLTGGKEESQEKMPSRNDTPITKTPSLKTKDAKLKLINPGHTYTEADEWEKEQLAKIHRKYQKAYLSIVEWERKKMEKAKRRLARTEAEIQRERSKAAEAYREELSDIERIANVERTETDAKKKKAEAKVKRKANKIRSTGEVPCSCFFF